MANWSNLKSSINSVIKTNANQEITGQVLQNVLNTIVSTVGENATYVGVATTSTNPGSPDGNVFYFATQAGTYANFGGAELEVGLNILLWNGSNWSATKVMTIKQEVGSSESSVMSQRIITNLVSEYNVSVNHPTEGIDGGNKYTLETAIAKVGEELRHAGLKVTFLDGDGKTETWEFQGGTFISAESWIQCGAKILTELEQQIKYNRNYIYKKFQVDGLTIDKRTKIEDIPLTILINSKLIICLESTNVEASVSIRNNVNDAALVFTPLTENYKTVLGESNQEYKNTGVYIALANYPSETPITLSGYYAVLPMEVPENGIILENDANLNYINKIGSYYAGNGNNILNKPNAEIDSFGLVCDRISAGRIRQTLTPSTKANVKYVRVIGTNDAAFELYQDWEKIEEKKDLNLNNIIEKSIYNLNIVPIEDNTYNEGYYNDTADFTQSVGRFCTIIEDSGTYDLSINSDCEFYVREFLVDTLISGVGYFSKAWTFNAKPGYRYLINIRKKDSSPLGNIEESGFSIKKYNPILNEVSDEAKSADFNTIEKNIFLVENYGILPGNEDNAEPLSNLIKIVYALGGGTIKFPIGNYNFKASVEILSNITLQGSGINKTVLYMLDSNETYTLFVGDIINNLKISDFTVDAYKMSDPGDRYSASYGKAFYLTRLTDCIFERLVLKGTPTTSLGIDFLNRVFINQICVIEGGRYWRNDLTNAHGGSGIGIGMGYYEEENFTIINCICEKCGNNGIFIEDQSLFKPTYTPTQKGYGQVVSNNIVRDGRNNGIAARGCHNTIFTDNVVYRNTNAGFSCDWFLSDFILSNNQLIGNKYGVYLSFAGETNNVTISENQISKNTEYGIYVNHKADNVLHPFSGKPATSDFIVKNIALISNYFDNNKTAIKTIGDSKSFSIKNNIEKESSIYSIDISGTHQDAVIEQNVFFGAKNIEENTKFTGVTSYVKDILVE